MKIAVAFRMNTAGSAVILIRKIWRLNVEM